MLLCLPSHKEWGHVALPLTVQFVRSVSTCAFPPIVRTVKHETLSQCWANVVAHRLRRWPSIKPALVQRFVFAI